MRNQAQQVVAEEYERKRREEWYGVKSKVRQLWAALSCSLVLFCILAIKVFLERKPRQQVVIDFVVVEVTPDDGVAHWLMRVCGWVALASAVALLWLQSGISLFHTRSASRGPVHATPTASRPTLTVNRPSRLGVASNWWAGGPAATSAVRKNTLQPSTDTQAVTTVPELDALIVDQLEGRAAAQTFSAPSVLMPLGAGGSLQGGGGSTTGSGVGVRYGDLMDPAKRGVRQATTAESELALLGIAHPERATTKLKQWVCDELKSVIAEVDKCDQWFSDKRIRVFDCSHPLTDWYELPAAASRPTTGFTGMTTSAASAAAPERIRKADALHNERRKLQQQNLSSMETFDSISKIDLRLSLERVLDVSLTFPSASELPQLQVQRRRRGILDRIRALATQRTLSGFRVASDNSDVPADPYIVVHVLRMRVAGLGNYILLPYQSPQGAAKDLSLLVGFNGDPFFYVRHRRAGQEHHMRTSEGPDSLFEALLLFFGVVRRFYGGSFGNVEGMVDLCACKVDSVFT